MVFRIAALACMGSCSFESYIVTCNATISACGNSERWQIALRLLNEMWQDKVDTDTVTHNAAISACEKSRQWQVALQLFSDMRRDKVSSGHCHIERDNQCMRKGSAVVRSVADLGRDLAAQTRV